MKSGKCLKMSLTNNFNPSLVMLVNDCFIVEVKSKDAMHPIDEAQILTYMKLAEIPKAC